MIIDQNSTRGLASMPIYADEVLVDFDNNELAATKAIEWLTQRELGFTAWHSGGRSIHLHIPCEPMTGLGVSGIHKRFVMANMAGADLSFYHGAGMFRLPGTLHEANPGQYKKLLNIYEGKLLSLQMYIPDYEVSPKYSLRAESERSTEESEKMLTYLMFRQVTEGGRNRHAYTIARTCTDLGYSYKKTREILDMWNETSCRPMLSESELYTTATSAFKLGVNHED
jgi:hypothetical protein